MTREEKQKHSKRVVDIILNCKVGKALKDSELKQLKNLFDFIITSPQLDTMQTINQINSILIATVDGFVVGLGYNPEEIEGWLKRRKAKR